MANPFKKLGSRIEKTSKFPNLFQWPKIFPDMAFPSVDFGDIRAGAIKDWLLQVPQIDIKLHLHILGSGECKNNNKYIRDFVCAYKL